ncbi:PepSY-associated TM helix domain-containing protein [Sphingomonas suaedae]|nr:PepSY domain-containing protein [Sphingomonas suaedae]
MVRRDTAGSLYRTVWRWHFYAGLFVLPFILILSVTGSIYLFKPQIDRWEERTYRGLSLDGAVTPDQQLGAVLTTYPTGRFNSYRVPEAPGDAAMIELIFFDGAKLDIFVSPQGKLLGGRDPASKLTETIANIHGSLLLGKWGDWLVELAASWTIVLILTGLYLWWPRPLRAAGTLYPRLNLRGRPLLRDIHRVTGFWIAGLVLVMLASGLPWAGAWGSGFRWVRSELGLVNGPQSWKVGADGKQAPPAVEAVHDHSAMDTATPSSMAGSALPAGLPLAAFVAKAREQEMPPPVVVVPPHAIQRFGPPTGKDWTVKSETQNRWLARQVTFDAETGAETARRGFADQHVVDRIVNTGVAWHEGQLFGLANQIIGVITALGLIAVSILGAVMWFKRRPAGAFGAPPTGRAPGLGMMTLILVLGLLLPLFGVSLLALLFLDRAGAYLRHRFRQLGDSLA